MTTIPRNARSVWQHAAYGIAKACSSLYDCTAPIVNQGCPTLISPTSKASSRRAPHCVFVVENLPVPFDRRVWQEARALRVAGWKVSVICPKTEKYPASREQIDGIEIYRHSIPLEARGRFAFVAEYVAALFHEARLLLQIFLKDGFDVIHACNPPDLIFLAAAPYKLLGKRFIFDHHDVSPELFIAKFGANSTMEKVLTFFEWMSFK